MVRFSCQEEIAAADGQVPGVRCRVTGAGRQQRRSPLRAEPAVECGSASYRLAPRGKGAPPPPVPAPDACNELSGTER